MTLPGTPATEAALQSLWSLLPEAAAGEVIEPFRNLHCVAVREGGQLALHAVSPDRPFLLLGRPSGPRVFVPFISFQ